MQGKYARVYLGWSRRPSSGWGWTRGTMHVNKKKRGLVLYLSEARGTFSLIPELPRRFKRPGCRALELKVAQPEGEWSKSWGMKMCTAGFFSGSVHHFAQIPVRMYETTCPGNTMKIDYAETFSILKGKCKYFVHLLHIQRQSSCLRIKAIAGHSVMLVISRWAESINLASCLWNHSLTRYLLQKQRICIYAVEIQG